MEKQWLYTGALIGTACGFAAASTNIENGLVFVLLFEIALVGGMGLYVND